MRREYIQKQMFGVLTLTSYDYFVLYISPYSALITLYQISISGARVSAKRSCAPLRLIWISDNLARAESPCPRKGDRQFRTTQHDHVDHITYVSETIRHTDGQLDLVVDRFNTRV